MESLSLIDQDTIGKGMEPASKGDNGRAEREDDIWSRNLQYLGN